MLTLRLILLLNFGGFCTIVLLTHLLAKGASRNKLLGWICDAFSTSVFVAPLSVIRVVIHTKSVEFMPFPLSLLLTVNSVMWLSYGIALKDIYVIMVLYGMYRKNKPVQDQKLPEHKGDIITENNKHEEKPEVVNAEIREKEEEKQQQEQEKPQKKQDQVGPHDQSTEHKDKKNKSGEDMV